MPIQINALEHQTYEHDDTAFCISSGLILKHPGWNLLLQGQL